MKLVNARRLNGSRRGAVREISMARDSRIRPRLTGEARSLNSLPRSSQDTTGDLPPQVQRMGGRPSKGSTSSGSGLVVPGIPLDWPSNYGPLTPLGNTLRIQAREGFRAGIIELKPGLYLVAEIPAESLKPEFGMAFLAPLALNAAAKALAHPEQTRQRVSDGAQALVSLVTPQEDAGSAPRWAEGSSAEGASPPYTTMEGNRSGSGAPRWHPGFAGNPDRPYPAQSQWGAPSWAENPPPWARYAGPWWQPDQATQYAMQQQGVHRSEWTLPPASMAQPRCMTPVPEWTQMGSISAPFGCDDKSTCSCRWRRG